MDDLAIIEAEEALLDVEEKEDAIALRSLQREQKRLDLRMRRAKLRTGPNMPEASQAQAKANDTVLSPDERALVPFVKIAKPETTEVVDITSETDEAGPKKGIKEEEEEEEDARGSLGQMMAVTTNGKASGNETRIQKGSVGQKDVDVNEKECQKLPYSFQTPVSQQQNASTVAEGHMSKAKTINEKNPPGADTDPDSFTTRSTTNVAKNFTTQMYAVDQAHSTRSGTCQVGGGSGLYKTSSACDGGYKLRVRVRTPVVPAKRPCDDSGENAAPKPSKQLAKRPRISSIHQELLDELEDIHETLTSKPRTERAVANADTDTKDPSHLNSPRKKRSRPPPGHFAVGTAAFPPEEIQHLLNRFCDHVLDELQRRIQAPTAGCDVPCMMFLTLRLRKMSKAKYTTYAQFSDDVRKLISSSSYCQCLPGCPQEMLLVVEQREADWKKCRICCEAVTVTGTGAHKQRREEIVDEWGKGKQSES